MQIKLYAYYIHFRYLAERLSGERATVENVERTSHTTVSFACQNDYESDFYFARVSRTICAAAALPPNRASSGNSPFASASRFCFM